MNRLQATLVIILALAVGYIGGYFTHIVRFPVRHAHPELAGKAGTEKPKPPVHPILAEVEKARKLHAAGKPREAQKLLLDQVRIYPQAAETRAARELLGAINTELFFSDANLYGKTEYVVQRGDSLARIASRLNSSPEMIMRANALDSTVIHPGDRLLVPDGDFTLTIDLPKERVVVHHGDGFFKQYPIQSIDPALEPAAPLDESHGDDNVERRRARSASARDVEEATPWVHLARPGYILYGVSEEGGVEPGAVEITEQRNRRRTARQRHPSPNPDIPPRGIALLKDDLAELQLLLSRGTPVTIIRERE